MKKIGLFLHSKPGFGGTFQYNQTLVTALESLPTNQFEIVFAYTNENWLEYLNFKKFKVIKLPEIHWAQPLGAKWKEKGLSYNLWKELTSDIHPIGSLLKQQNCDLWIFPSQDSYSFQLDVPVLSTVHDLMHRYESHFPEVSQNGIREFREWLYSNMVAETNGILVDSNIGKQHVIESYSAEPEKVFVLPYVAPKYIYDFLENDTSVAIIKKYSEVISNLPEKFMFYPAQFWEHKNHLKLVESVKNLKNNNINVKFVFAGTHDGSDRNETYNKLRKAIEDYDLEENFIFLGYVPDELIPYLYKKARALIMPTSFGPTNIPPLEAFVLNCPVAISGIYGIKEQLGDAALYFDPKDIDEISKAIEKLWLDNVACEELIQKGKKHTEIWSKEKFLDRLINIIEILTYKG